jgi:nitroreductase
MADPNARAALGIPDGERIVVMIDVGEPAEAPEPKPRRAAAEATTWLP